MTKSYCPERGDVVWLEFMPQSGHEQSGRRPALTLSPSSYNRKVGVKVAIARALKEAGVAYQHNRLVYFSNGKEKMKVML